MDIKRIGYDCMERIHVVEYWDMWWGLVNTIIKFHVLENVSNFLNIWEIINFSRRTLVHRDKCPIINDQRKLSPVIKLNIRMEMAAECMSLVNGKLSLCLIEHYAMKTHGGVDL
jgi:hypothetical protein